MLTLLTLVPSLCLAPADGALRPGIHDWTIRYNIVPEFPALIPTPHPGWDLPVGSPTYLTLYQTLMALDMPVGIMLQEGTAPVSGWADPDALESTMTLVPKLDYVFADFEGGAAEINVIKMAEIVRYHPDPAFNLAWLGAYNFWPGHPDMASLYPHASNRIYQTALYWQLGLDVAMPPAYPAGAHQLHTWPLWGDFVAPNVRAAMFWAPLERVSLARSTAPSPSQMVIPWITHFLESPDYPPVDPPPIEDAAALLKHYRLRGVDGYLLLWSFLPEYPTPQYRKDMYEAWHSLDFLFAGDGQVTYLNMTTDKLSGVQWSGITRDGITAVLVSNLGNSDAQVTLPSGPWPQGDTVLVPMGQHRLFIIGERLPPVTAPVKYSPLSPPPPKHPQKT